MSDIVPLADPHLDAVARLLRRTFRGTSVDVPPSPALLADLRAIFLDHPDRDAEIPSLVWQKPGGGVGGFMGVVPLPMRLDGRTVRAALPSSLMVDDPAKNPLVGARLVRAFLSGPQDVSISEPINERAQGLWRKLGAEVPVTESMEWLKVLRPVGLAVALAADKRAFLGRLRGVARLADRVALRLGGSRLKTDAAARPLETVAAGDEALLAFLTDAGSDYRLRPDWSPATFAWMLRHVEASPSRGTPVRRLVLDRKGKPVGAFLFQGGPGRIAFVLHLAVRNDAARAVFDALFAEAAAAGCVAVKGRTQARLLPALLTRNAILFRRHGMMIHTRDSDIRAAIHAGDASTGGLGGESWMRPVADLAY